MADSRAAPDWATFHDPSGKYTLKHQGAYPVVEVRVNQADIVRSEAGAMISMHPDVKIDFTTAGKKGTGCLACCCGEESFFLTEYTPMHPLPPGVGLDVLLAPSTPGNLTLLHLDGRTKWRIEPGAYLAGDAGVLIGCETQNISQGCCSGEGFFLLTAEGTGRLVLNAYGSIMRYDLAPGEQRVVDNGMLVAWNSDMTYEIQKAGSSWWTSIMSGEGLVCTFTGPGTLFLQTRSIVPFAQAVAKHMPTQNDGEGGGGGGGGE